MKIRTTILLVAAGALFGTACSLILPFDPEGQPCDAEGKCLEGYGCVDNVCKKGAETPVNCAQCPAGDCVPGTNTCLPNTCAYKICNSTYACVDDQTGAGPHCEAIPSGPANLGGPCFDDTGCYGSGGSVRHCLIGAVPTQTSDTLRGGVCVEECGPNDTCTLSTAECRSFPVGDGGVTKVCLPRNTLTPCASNNDCKRAPGFVCTVFDNPLSGPLLACDLGMPSGAKPGEACVRRSSDGGTLCENGLCIPDPATATNAAAVCGQTCDPNSCVGEYCADVEFQVPYTGELIRYVPMCIPQISNCFSCAADPTGACKADAPHCVVFNGESRCLGACSPDAGSLQCPPNYQCTDVDGGSYCTPLQGACP